jgi:catechol 2,3-dioxygenase-like lactoylglutathione lyase family enzyme
MTVVGLTPILNVSSLEESFAWFEKLGWHKDWEWGDPPGFGAVTSGKSEIFLCVDGQGSRGGPLPRHVGDDDTGGVWMTWWVHSLEAVDEAHRLALEQGVIVTQPPVDCPWNVRECHIRHPDGHTFRVGCGLPEE